MRPKEKFDINDVNTIVNAVQKMFPARELITVRKLKKALEENCDLKNAKTKLWRCLKAQENPAATDMSCVNVEISADPGLNFFEK